MENSFGNTIEEIKEITQNLMNKYELSIDEDNLGLVQKPFFYLSILEEVVGIDNIFYTSEMKENFLLLSQADQIDFVINYLHERLMDSELEHLSGDEIIQGNLEHIKKLLHVFEFLSDQHQKAGLEAPGVIPEEDSKYENLNTYNTKSEIHRNESPVKGRRLTKREGFPDRRGGLEHEFPQRRVRASLEGEQERLEHPRPGQGVQEGVAGAVQTGAVGLRDPLGLREPESTAQDRKRRRGVLEQSEPKLLEAPRAEGSQEETEDGPLAGQNGHGDQPGPGFGSPIRKEKNLRRVARQVEHF